MRGLSGSSSDHAWELLGAPIIHWLRPARPRPKAEAPRAQRGRQTARGARLSSLDRLLADPTAANLAAAQAQVAQADAALRQARLGLEKATAGLSAHVTIPE